MERILCLLTGYVFGLKKAGLLVFMGDFLKTVLPACWCGW